MSVNVGDDGRRSVQAEVEVPGSPEEVWQAIASGPGISSWFVPTTVEEKLGGTTVSDFGMGMESESTISKWEPPHTFIKDGEGMGEGAPPVATEWVVEARSGGRCLVRVVHSWFASTDDWDGQWESVEQGWKIFFSILLLKLTHFAGLDSAAFDLAGMGSDWSSLAGPLGLSDAAVGQEIRSGEGAPLLVGEVALADHGDEKQVLVLTSEPGRGIFHAMAMPYGESLYVAVRLFVYGDGASGVVESAKPSWDAWFGEKFPMG